MRQGNFSLDEQEEYAWLCRQIRRAVDESQDTELVLHATTTIIAERVKEEQSLTRRTEAIVDVLHMLAHKLETKQENVD